MAKAPTEIRSLARAHTRMALRTLVHIAKQTNAPAAARVAAAQALMDRGWGKPTQPLGGDVDFGPIRLESIERTIIDPEDSDSAGVQAASEPGEV